MIGFSVTDKGSDALLTAIAFLLLNCVSAAAQTAPTTSATTEGSLADTLRQLTQQTSAVREVGEAIRVNTAIEVAGAPLATSSGGFAFKLDKSTGLEARTASTFGPAFAERAITSGAGKMSFAGTLMVATYDTLGPPRKSTTFPTTNNLDRFPLAKLESSDPLFNQTGIMSLVLNSETTVIQGVMGATDILDVGVAVPIVRVRLNALSWVEDANGSILIRATGKGESTGLGDVALLGKLRLLRFGKKPPPDAPLTPDPGGFALVATVRLPTGSRENLRGLGITRTLGSLVFSAGKKKFRPHANIGYEWWSKGIDIVSDFQPTVTARHSFQYAVGIELEAAPKLTVIVDFLSRQINGGGKLGYVSSPISIPNLPVTSATFAGAQSEGILKQSLAPGLKWNLKGKVLLSLHGIFSIRDNGLRDKFTPVVGLDWTF